MNNHKKHAFLLLTALFFGSFAFLTFASDDASIAGDQPPADYPTNPVAADEPVATVNHITGNSTSFTYNESTWNTDTENDIVNEFNITNTDYETSQYTNVSISNAKFNRQNITIQKNGTGWNEFSFNLGDTQNNLAQAFTIDNTGKFKLSSFSVLLNGLDLGQEVDVYIYNSSGTKPDTNITNAFTLSSSEAGSKKWYNYDIDDSFPLLNGNTNYFVVLNYTGDGLAWVMIDDDYKDGESYYDEESNWLLCSDHPSVDPDYDFGLALELEGDGYLNETQLNNVNVTANGISQSLTYQSDGRGYAEFTDPISFDDYTNINFFVNSTAADWNITFDYDCEYILLSDNRYTLEANYTSEIGSDTQWRLVARDIDFTANNNSLYVPVPDYFDKQSFTASPYMLDDERQLLDGWLVRITEGQSEKVTLRFIDTNDWIGGLSTDRTVDTWHLPRINASATPNAAGNITFTLFYENETVYQRYTLADRPADIRADHAFTFDAAAPRGNYTLMASFTNGTAADAVRLGDIPMRYLVTAARRADLDLFTVSPDHGFNATHWYARNDNYDLSVTWGSSVMSRTGVRIDRNMTVFPVRAFDLYVRVTDADGNMLNCSLVLRDNDTGEALTLTKTYFDGAAMVSITHRISLDRQFGLEVYVNGSQRADFNVSTTDENDLSIWNFTLTDEELNGFRYSRANPLEIRLNGYGNADSYAADDGYEPNDDRASASAITPGSYDLSLAGEGPEDWLNFSAEAEDTVNVVISLSGPAESYLFIRLSDPNDGTVHTETVISLMGYQFVAELSGLYTIRVTNSSNEAATYQNYTLQLTVTAPVGDTNGDGDDNEENGDTDPPGGDPVMLLIILAALLVAVIGIALVTKRKKAKQQQIAHKKLFEGFDKNLEIKGL